MPSIRMNGMKGCNTFFFPSPFVMFVILFVSIDVLEILTKKKESSGDSLSGSLSCHFDLVMTITYEVCILYVG